MCLPEKERKGKKKEMEQNKNTQNLIQIQRVNLFANKEFKKKKRNRYLFVKNTERIY